MEKFKQKFSSRKFWLAIATIISGILMMFGWSENNVETLSGAIVIVGGTLGYMIAESKVDAARVKEAVDAADKMIDAIKDETE